MSAELHSKRYTEEDLRGDVKDIRRHRYKLDLKKADKNELLDVLSTAFHDARISGSLIQANNIKSLGRKVSHFVDKKYLPLSMIEEEYLQKVIHKTFNTPDEYMRHMDLGTTLSLAMNRAVDSEIPSNFHSAASTGSIIKRVVTRLKKR